MIKKRRFKKQFKNLMILNPKTLFNRQQDEESVMTWDNLRCNCPIALKHILMQKIINFGQNLLQIIF